MALQIAPRQRVMRRGLPVEKSLIATCCVCGLVRDDSAASLDRWVTKRIYEKTHGVTLAGSPFTHTYCSGCHTDFMQRVRPSQRTLITSPINQQLFVENGSRVE